MFLRKSEGDLAVVVFEDGFGDGVEFVVEEALAKGFAEVDDKVFVVDAGESFGGDFVDFEEVVKVGFVVVFTTFTGAGWVDGREIGAEASIFDIDAAVFGVESTVSSHAGGTDAIKGVAAVFDAEDEVAGFAAHTKKMAGLLDRENFVV